MIKLGKPLFINGIGNKPNQEDYLYPRKPGDDERVFILCDGMGGHDRGEQASMTVANALGNSLNNFKVITKEDFEESLDKAYDALDEIDTGSEKKPGTTLACCCFNNDSCLVAHIGDSRIYHIRPSLYKPSQKRGGILYQSSDHSLVNDLLKVGEITQEEARNFTHKNIITRAMQPHLEKRFKADIYTFNDIRQGDYFFICSDGIIESISNEQLCKIISDPDNDDEDKINVISAICLKGSNDNYSCWLIPIESAEIKSGQSYSDTIMADKERSKKRVEITDKKDQTAGKIISPQSTLSVKITEKKRKSGRLINYVLICVIILFIAVLALALFTDFFASFNLMKFKNGN